MPCSAQNSHKLPTRWPHSGEAHSATSPRWPKARSVPALSADLHHELANTLEEARHLGFLGPGPVRDQITRSLAFVAAAAGPPELGVDLGTGGGTPGLAMALTWTTSRWLFIDSNQRRSDWLRTAVDRLGLAGRCEVVCERAELVGRSPYRQMASLVTARGFGHPAPTAECAAPLLRTGAQLLVAEPPQIDPERWPADGLALVGLSLKSTRAFETSVGPVSISCLTTISPCPSTYPRRVGVPFKRHLF